MTSARTARAGHAGRSPDHQERRTRLCRAGARQPRRRGRREGARDPGYILVGKRPWGLALTADEDLLYVANGLSDDITVIDTRTRKVLKSIPVGRVPYGILIDDYTKER